MVHKYKKKISGLPHSKKGQAFYLEVLRQHYCGHKASAIAQTLAVSEPTVRRAIKNIRSCVVTTNEAFVYFQRLAAKHKIQRYINYEDMIVLLWNFYYGAYNTSLNDFHECFTECPLKLNPRKFVNKYVGFDCYVGKKYELWFPGPKDITGLVAYLNKIMGCKYCRMKGKLNIQVNAKEGVHHLFLADSQLYIDIAFQLSKVRIRNFDTFDLMLLYLEACYIGIIDDVIIKRGQKIELRGGTKKEGVSEMEELFIKITADIFELILKGKA